MYKSITVEQKPWFFIYRYSAEKIKLEAYMKATRAACKMHFNKSLDELIASECCNESEEEFIAHYEKYMPVSRAPGTMNRICWRIEDAFKTTNVVPEVEFDYTILTNECIYSEEEFEAVKQLYEEYNKNVKLILKKRNKNEGTGSDAGSSIEQLQHIFLEECALVCPNSNVLSNIVLDICYSSRKNNTFVWDVIGESVYQNVLANSGNKLHIPIKDDNGDIEFYGKRFSIYEKMIGGENDDYIE